MMPAAGDYGRSSAADVFRKRRKLLPSSMMDGKGGGPPEYNFVSGSAPNPYSFGSPEYASYEDQRNVSSSYYDPRGNAVHVGTAAAPEYVVSDGYYSAGRKRPTVANVMEHEGAHSAWNNEFTPEDKEAYRRSMQDLETAQKTGSKSLNDPKNPLFSFAQRSGSNPFASYTTSKNVAYPTMKVGTTDTSVGNATDRAISEAQAVEAENYAGNEQRNPFRAYYRNYYSQTKPLPPVSGAVGEAQLATPESLAQYGRKQAMLGQAGPTVLSAATANVMGALNANPAAYAMKQYAAPVWKAKTKRMTGEVKNALADSLSASQTAPAVPQQQLMRAPSALPWSPLPVGPTKWLARAKQWEGSPGAYISRKWGPMAMGGSLPGLAQIFRKQAQRPK